MDFIRKALKELCSLMTLSGYEKRGKKRLFDLVSLYFDEMTEDSFGNFVFIKRCLKKNAPKLMMDAHFDTVGMMVTDILEGGFLSVVNIGGLDTRILPSSEVTVYGKEEIYGLISSIPPHLTRKSGEKRSNPKIEELYVDTGYSKEELEKIVSVGDPIFIKGEYTELLNGYASASGLDDKACVCAIFDAVRQMEKSKMEYDVYVTVSAQEETGKCGAAMCAYAIKPDIAIITDVNFGSSEGDNEFETVKCGKGAAIDVSSLSDRRLTRGIMKLLDRENIPYQVICEPTNTGTNNELVSVTGLGIPTVVMSVPLRSMHTPVETLNINDISSLSNVLKTVAYTEMEAL